MNALNDFLAALNINYQTFEHQAVYTCEQAKEIIPNLPGAPTKNLFLRDEKGKRHFLVSTIDSKTTDLKKLSSTLNSTKLSFASPERLKKHLDIEPGSVSLLALLNDKDHQVELIIDNELWQNPSLCCHPLHNQATYIIKTTDLRAFFAATGHNPKFVDI